MPVEESHRGLRATTPRSDDVAPGENSGRIKHGGSFSGLLKGVLPHGSISPDIPQLQAALRPPTAREEETLRRQVEGIPADVCAKDRATGVFLPRVPHLDGLVPACCEQDIRVAWVPFEGVDRVAVPRRAETVRRAERPLLSHFYCIINAHASVVAPRGEARRPRLVLDRVQFIPLLLACPSHLTGGGVHELELAVGATRQV